MPPKPLLNHLSALVKIYPETTDQKAVKRALDYCQKILKLNGLSTKSHLNNGYHSLTAYTIDEYNPTIVLQAHVDVVRALDKPEMAITSDKISGRGVYDMLFAVASYLYFVEQHKDKLNSINIGLMLTGEEEIGGFNGVGELVEQGYGGQVVILPDAGEDFGDLSIAAKGAYNFDIVARGVAHHGSRPWEGDGAANKLIHMIHELMSFFDHSNQDNSTITVTRFEGGGAINRGPGEACARIDIRIKDHDDYPLIQKHIEAICSKHGGEIRNLIEAPSVQLDLTDSKIQDFIKIYARYNQKPITYSKAHGGSDARFFAEKGIPVIMLRPDGFGAHSDQEELSASSLAKFYDLLEEYILKTAKIS